MDSKSLCQHFGEKNSKDKQLWGSVNNVFPFYYIFFSSNMHENYKHDEHFKTESTASGVTAKLIHVIETKGKFIFLFLTSDISVQQSNCRF